MRPALLASRDALRAVTNTDRVDRVLTENESADLSVSKKDDNAVLAATRDTLRYSAQHAQDTPVQNA